jgi:hypothetical protein
MNSRLIAIMGLVLASVSCDKVKSLTTQVTNLVKDQIAARGHAGAPGVGGAAKSTGDTTVDAELQKLVDQTAEGVIFRKDLPFPTRLEVTVSRHDEMSGRFTRASAFGKQAAALKGTQTTVTKLARDGNQVRYKLEQSSFDLPASDQPGAEKKSAANPIEQLPPSSQPMTFRKTGKTWAADNLLDFRSVAMAKELAPVLEQLLIDGGLASRPLWFSKRRFKVGDSLVVSGASLPMLLLGKTKGSVTLKLEAFEGVAGHPCGVFAVAGDYSRKQVPDFEGALSDEDVTIQSGKIWLSLIYPLILREELDTIQTLKAGRLGGLVVSGQGSIKVDVTRAWKRTEP